MTGANKIFVRHFCLYAIIKREYPNFGIFHKKYT